MPRGSKSGVPGDASNAGAVYRGVNSSGTTFSFSKLAFASAIATAQAAPTASSGRGIPA